MSTILSGMESRKEVEEQGHVEMFEHVTVDTNVSKDDNAKVAAACLEAIGGLTMTAEEAKLHRRVNLKFDVFILPFLTLVYLLNALDRSNIGNAATVGFAADIHSSSKAVNNAVTIFFATFIGFMPPYMYMAKKVGFTRWMTVTMALWGAMTIANAFVKSQAQLVAVRLLIGAFESGFYPCVAYYLSSCYVRYDFALRMSIFFGAFSLGGAFSGLIAYGILQIKSTLHAWQYLFIIEGTVTVVLAAISFFWLPKHIGTAWFLTVEQRAWAIERMARDSGGHDYQERGITREDIRDTVKDWKLYPLFIINTCTLLQSNAFAFFLPLIVQQLGYKSYHANLYAVPIYVVGFVSLEIIAYSSDYFKERTIHFLVGLGFTIVGLILTIALGSPKARYAALCILQIGNFAVVPLGTTVLANNTPNPGHRALALAVNGMCNVSGIIGGQVYLQKYAPRYILPFSVSLGIASFGWILMFALRFTLLHVNKTRAAKVLSSTQEEIDAENAGNTRRSDKKWTYQYST